MLALPVFTGATLRLREGPLPSHVWWLAACWVAGYLCFQAATILAKSPPARRDCRSGRRCSPTQP